MVQAVNSEIAKRGRLQETTRGSQRTQWRVEYLGTRSKKIEGEPQAFIAEMDAHTTVKPHFHQVDQFQVLIDGSGTLGRNPAPVIALHYADHHTAYGPIDSGPVGLSFFTIRARTDPGAIHLHKPDYKEQLTPSKRRYLLAGNIPISTEPVLENRIEAALEDVFQEEYDRSDGLSAFVLRLGAGRKCVGPDPAATAGQYYLVLNGSLELGGESYPKWSLVFLRADESALDVCAGPQGLETLIMNFPRIEERIAA